MSKVLYLYDEYCSIGCEPPSVHAWAIRNRGAWIPGAMEVEAHGRNQRDGYGLIEMYRNFGLWLEAAANLFESGIQEVWQRMQTGELKVFASLQHYLSELRDYHRDGRDQIVTGRDQLQNATRCLVSSGLSSMRTEPVKPMPDDYTEYHHGPDAWMR